MRGPTVLIQKMKRLTVTWYITHLSDRFVAITQFTKLNLKRNYNRTYTVTWDYLLPTSTFICLSVFPHLKHRCSQNYYTWRRYGPPRDRESRKLTHLFWRQKVTGQGYEAQKHCRRGSRLASSSIAFAPIFDWPSSSTESEKVLPTCRVF